MAHCKTAVTPLLTHWSYCSLALSHRFVFKILSTSISSEHCDRHIFHVCHQRCSVSCHTLLSYFQKANENNCSHWSEYPSVWRIRGYRMDVDDMHGCWNFNSLTRGICDCNLKYVISKTFWWLISWMIPVKITRRWRPLYLIDDMSAFAKAWRIRVKFLFSCFEMVCVPRLRLQYVWPVKYGQTRNEKRALARTLGAETEWAPFCRRHYQANFLVWEWLYFDFHLIEIGS